jgi:predicted HicB family RNase H-like nuclease
VTYKGYEGVAVLDEEAGIFSGEVINTRDVITFQGDSVNKLLRAFQESVDDYLDFCKARNEEPEKPFSRTFIVRMSPELHRDLAIEARRKSVSLNAYVIQLLIARGDAAIRSDKPRTSDQTRARRQSLDTPRDTTPGSRVEGLEVTPYSRPN